MDTEARAELTDDRKFSDRMLIDELLRRGRLHTIEVRSVPYPDGLEVQKVYETDWLTVDEVFV